MEPDLQSEQNYVKKLLENNGSIKRIYKEIRQKARYKSVGDYPIVSFICFVAKGIGVTATKKSVVETLRIAQDGEFKKIRQDSEIIRQLCV